MVIKLTEEVLSMKRVLACVVLIMGLAVFGCAEKQVVAPPPQPGEVTPPSQPKEVEQPKKVPVTEQVSEQQIAKVESEDVPSKVEEISGMFKDIYFDYDKYEINEDGKLVLRSVADYLTKNRAYKILIEGHCDDRGTSEYNLALGDKRAKSAKDFLLSLGVPSSRADGISYGKEKPLCSERTEECWAKNRRAHFVILKGKK
jgi:peptidoglycan-associated lipoprotein